MFKKNIIFVLYFILISTQFSIASSAVLFNDNFDAHPDWQPRPNGAVDNMSPGGASIVCSYSSTSCAVSPPTGWNYYRDTGLWWGPTYQDTIRISNQAGRGGSGKSFIVYNESNAGASGDGWGADGILSKLFDQDYPELYVRAWVRFQAGFSWNTAYTAYLKMLRITHFDRSGDIFAMFSGGTNTPILIWDVLRPVTGDLKYANALRFDPQETDYNNQVDNPVAAWVAFTDDNAILNTEWHCIELHVKMNTYSGDGVWNNDGIYEVWYDGVQQESYSTVKWVKSGTDSGIGWNTVNLGGNAYNTYTSASNFGEQWYAIDDVVVSTEYSGPPSPPKDLTATSDTDSNVTLHWSAGKSANSVVLNEYKIYYGASSDTLDSIIKVGNATNYTVDSLAKGKYYFAVTAYSKAEYDVNENESLPSNIVSALVGTTESVPLINSIKSN